MASADFSRQALLRRSEWNGIRETSSGKKHALSPHVAASFTPTAPCSYRTSLCLTSLSAVVCLMRFLFISSGFASSFFQPTPRDAHLAFGYEVATAGPSRDFHPLERAHAEHTRARACRLWKACGPFTCVSPRILFSAPRPASWMRRVPTSGIRRGSTGCRA